MNETEIKDIIHNCYLKILKRVPDLEGLNYYLELMKSGKINKEKLEQMAHQTKNLAKPDATETIVDQILQMIN